MVHVVAIEPPKQHPFRLCVPQFVPVVIVLCDPLDGWVWRGGGARSVCDGGGADGGWFLSGKRKKHNVAWGKGILREKVNNVLEMVVVSVEKKLGNSLYFSHLWKPRWAAHGEERDE